MLLEITDELQVKLALVSIQVQKHHLRVVVGTLWSLHHRNRVHLDLAPLVVLGLLVVLLLEVGSHSYQQRVDQLGQLVCLRLNCYQRRTVL